MRIWVAFALSLAVSGCATVTKGTTESLTFTSEPPEAEVLISTGQHCPSTPCTFEFNRKQDFIATFKKPGYKDETVPVNTRVAGSGGAAFAGNVLIGGVVGMGVDAATGATLEHYPNPVSATLTALAPSKAEPKNQSKALKIPRKQATPPVS